MKRRNRCRKKEEKMEFGVLNFGLVIVEKEKYSNLSERRSVKIFILQKKVQRTICRTRFVSASVISNNNIFRFKIGKPYKTI